MDRRKRKQLLFASIVIIDTRRCKDWIRGKRQGELPVELSSEKMFVNVPWTDTNTTYTAGSGLSLSGTTFSVSSAPKWGTSRTLSLSGDASGSVSWDGSANATLSVTVADNSHNHDKLYGGSSWQTVNLNTIADGISSGYFSYERVFVRVKQHAACVRQR